METSIVFAFYFPQNVLEFFFRFLCYVPLQFIYEPGFGINSFSVNFQFSKFLVKTFSVFRKKLRKKVRKNGRKNKTQTLDYEKKQKKIISASPLYAYTML